jgi:hypothetical protein
MKSDTYVPRETLLHERLGSPPTRRTSNPFDRAISRHARRIAPLPLKHVELKAVTLCIAAHAEHHGDRKIVFCADALVGDDYSVLETAFKAELDIARGVIALCSGPLDQIEDVVAIYKRRFSERPPKIQEYKEELAVGYREFKDSLTRRGIKRPTAELIIGGFIEGEPKIAHVGPQGIYACPYFYAIGTGAVIADAMLRWRHPGRFSDLYGTMYFVYEAKRMSEASPFVGKSITHLFIGSSASDGNMSLEQISGKRLKLLEKDFKRFGPREFSPTYDFPWTEDNY